jgi:hypothetical protein
MIILHGETSSPFARKVCVWLRADMTHEHVFSRTFHWFRDESIQNALLLTVA